MVVWFQPWNDLIQVEKTDREWRPEHPAELSAWHSALLQRIKAWKAVHKPHPPTSPLFALELLREHTGTTRVPRADRRDNLARVKAAAAREHARLLVALLPPGLEYQKGGPTPYGQQVAADCKALGIEFLDLEDSLAGRDPADVIMPGDPGHFMPTANRIFALMVANALRAPPSTASR